MFGGQYDEHRDAPERLEAQVAHFAEAILVAVDDERVVGTVSLVDDGRIAWLYRFAVELGDNESTVAQALFDEGTAVLHRRGHRQVLVYTPTNDAHLQQRYTNLGMHEGGTYTCFWSDLSD